MPLGKTCKRWFGLDSFSIPLPSNNRFAEIRELRILPRNRCFYFEFVYSKEIEKPVLNQDNALLIDPGLNNWLTCVSNLETSFIIDGKHVKSMNRWYNKQISTLKENKPQGFWSNRLAAITEKRNRQMRDGTRIPRHLCGGVVNPSPIYYFANPFLPKSHQSKLVLNQQMAVKLPVDNQ